MFLKSFLAVLYMFVAYSMADVHPDLKDAIDDQNWKKAKALVENVGVKDVYCPSDLPVEYALSIYEISFAEDPAAMWENCDSEFIKKAEEKICKTSVSLCKHYVRNNDFDVLKKGLEDVLESKLYENSDEYFLDEIELFGRKLADKLKDPFFFDTSYYELYKTLKKIGMSKPSYKKMRNEKLSRGDYSWYCPLMITKDDAVDSLIYYYTGVGFVPDSSIAFYCRLYPSIDKDIEKRMGVNIFNCAVLSDFKTENEKCIKSDSAYIWKSSTKYAYVCEDRLWREADDAEQELGMLCVEKYKGFFNGNYVCEYSWRPQTIEESATGLICEIDYQGLIVKKYICDDGKWREASFAETSTGKLCDSESEGSLIDDFVCQDNQWRNATSEELELKQVCKTDNQGETRGGYVCDNELWKKIKGRKKTSTKKR